MGSWRKETTYIQIMTKYDEIRKNLNPNKNNNNNKANLRTLRINAHGQKTEKTSNRALLLHSDLAH